MSPAIELAQPWMVQVARANCLRNWLASASGWSALRASRWLDSPLRVCGPYPCRMCRNGLSIGETYGDSKFLSTCKTRGRQDEWHLKHLAEIICVSDTCLQWKSQACFSSDYKPRVIVLKILTPKKGSGTKWGTQWTTACHMDWNPAPGKVTATGVRCSKAENRSQWKYHQTDEKQRSLVSPPWCGR